MADVRSLLAAERQSRRIAHPHLNYSKTGALTCNICHLNIKSEQLWPGHQKSLNHRKNLQKLAAPSPTKPAKRKIESVDDVEDSPSELQVDSRKKQRSFQDQPDQLEPQAAAAQGDTAGPGHVALQADEAHSSHGPHDPAVNVKPPDIVKASQPAPAAEAAVDEDEWAAFEREVVPLARPDNAAAATIEAAPISAAELAEHQQRTNAVQQREDEAEAEKQDEGRRMEEEFEVMEEMEDRVKRLRARREAIRNKDPSMTTKPTSTTTLEYLPAIDNESPDHRLPAVPPAMEDSSADEDVDDWYS